MTSTIYLSLLLINNFINLDSCQLLQPRKVMQKIRDLHESSNKLIGSDDSMSLYVDISEASKYPLRDDLRLRVFNKDSNVTVCDQKMANYAHIGKFPCNFLANQADLHHGVNHFEFEVYSDLNGKRFASQKIPDIHLFDHFLYEGYYEDFYKAAEIQSYTMKTILSSLGAVFLAHVIEAGPDTATGELNRVVVNMVKLSLRPVVAVSKAVVDIQRKSSVTFSRFLFFMLMSSVKLVQAVTTILKYHFDAVLHFSGMKGLISIRTAADFSLIAEVAGEQFKSLLTSMASSLHLLFDIFHSGLSSPFFMLGRFLEEGLLYFILLFGNIQKKGLFQYSISTTGGDGGQGGQRPPRSVKRTHVVSLQKKYSAPIKSIPSPRVPVKTPVKFPLEAVILSRAAPSAVKNTGYAADVVNNIVSTLPVQRKQQEIKEQKEQKSRGIVKNFIRTAGLCLALVLLAPGSNAFRLGSIRAVSQRVRGSQAAKFVSTKIFNLKFYLIGLGSKCFKRSGSTPVPTTNIVVDNGYNSFQGASKSCPFLNKSRTSTYSV